MIAIRSTETLESVEGLLERLSSDRLDALEIPNFLERDTVGAEAAVIQLILTWSAFSRSKSKGAVLATTIPQNVDLRFPLEGLSHSAFGLVALLSATKLTRRNSDDISKIGFSLLTEAYKNRIPFTNDADKSGCSLIISDRQIAPPQLLPYARLSLDEFRVASEQRFTQATAVLLEKFWRASGIEPSSGPARYEIPDIIYQLLVNAEEWGSTKNNWAPVETPNRGVIFRSHQVDKLIKKQHKGPILNYLHRLSGIAGKPKRLLEISIFDAGIGLAQRFLGRPLGSKDSIAVEMDAVINCWRKHTSTSFHTSRGLGLFGVMRKASQLNGFLRLRTGRLNIFRDFIEEPHPLADEKYWRLQLPKSSDEGFDYFRDWSSGDIFPECAPYAKGACFSLLLAAGESQRQLF